MGQSRQNCRTKRSLIKDAVQKAQAGSSTNRRKTYARREGRRENMPTKKESALFLVKGDRLSKTVHQEARQAGFDGRIEWLTPQEAHAQARELPVLITSRRSYGPDTLPDYFRWQKSGGRLLP
jgi:hypothetical protein